VTAGGTVTVRVTFFGGFRRFLLPGAEGPQRYALPPPARVTDLLAVIGIDASADATVAVNGEIATPDTRLPDSAEVMILSPMEGGAP
jgi:sulfur carrier protein ThiS